MSVFDQFLIEARNPHSYLSLNRNITQFVIGFYLSERRDVPATLAANFVAHSFTGFHHCLSDTHLYVLQNHGPRNKTILKINKITLESTTIPLTINARLIAILKNGSLAVIYGIALECAIQQSGDDWIPIKPVKYTFFGKTLRRTEGSCDMIVFDDGTIIPFGLTTVDYQRGLIYHGVCPMLVHTTHLAIFKIETVTKSCEVVSLDRLAPRESNGLSFKFVKRIRLGDIRVDRMYYDRDYFYMVIGREIQIYDRDFHYLSNTETDCYCAGVDNTGSYLTLGRGTITYHQAK